MNKYIPRIIIVSVLLVSMILLFSTFQSTETNFLKFRSKDIRKPSSLSKEQSIEKAKKCAQDNAQECFEIFRSRHNQDEFQKLIGIKNTKLNPFLEKNITFDDAGFPDHDSMVKLDYFFDTQLNPDKITGSVFICAQGWLHYCKREWESRWRPDRKNIFYGK